MFNLPGEGKLLELADAAFAPQELRMACGVLKNAGLVVHDVRHLRRTVGLERLLRAFLEEEVHATAIRKLPRTRLEVAGRSGKRLRRNGRSSSSCSTASLSRGDGAPNTNRTCDLPLRRGLLYPLSYRGARRVF